MNGKKKVLTNIVLLGLVSLFVDMSTEMVYPLIPLFLTATLGASPAIVGIIEGIAESIASLLKVFSGYIGDVYHKKKRLALAGIPRPYSTRFFFFWLRRGPACWSQESSTASERAYEPLRATRSWLSRATAKSSAGRSDCTK
jgi:Na+/melibiose symporter-like transporter